jgi:uncharacterized protein (TIGR03437 family)
MGPAEFAMAAPTAEGRFPTTVAGTRALFDGVPGALVYTSQKQVSAAVPYAAGGKTQVQLVMEYNGQRSDPYRLEVTDVAPEISRPTPRAPGRERF